MIITIERTIYEPILNKSKEVIGWSVGFAIDRDGLSYYNPTTIMRSQLSNPSSYTEQEVMGIAIRNALPSTLTSFYGNEVQHTPQFDEKEIENWGIGIVPHQEEEEEEEKDGEATDSDK